MSNSLPLLRPLTSAGTRAKLADVSLGMTAEPFAQEILKT